MEYKSLGDKKTTNSLLHLLIEWSMIFGSRSKVREKLQFKRSKRLGNQLKTFAIERTLKMKASKLFFSFWKNLKLGYISCEKQKTNDLYL